MKASKITAVDFFEDLSSPYARKRFFVGFIAFSILCLIFLYFVEHFAPEGILRNVAIAILVQLLSSCIIVIFFYFLYLHFIGPPPTAGQVTTVRAEDIKPRLRQLTDDASRYTFWGRSGSYFRAVPLIELDRISRKNKKNIDIEILLPDPTDANLIKSYNGIIESLGEVAETDLLLCNVVATTLACAILCAITSF